MGDLHSLFYCIPSTSSCLRESIKARFSLSPWDSLGQGPCSPFLLSELATFSLQPPSPTIPHPLQPTLRVDRRPGTWLGSGFLALTQVCERLWHQEGCQRSGFSLALQRFPREPMAGPTPLHSLGLGSCALVRSTAELRNREGCVGIIFPNIKTRKLRFRKSKEFSYVHVIAQKWSQG